MIETIEHPVGGAILDPLVADHLFALAVFVLFPVYSRLVFPRVLDTIRERGEAARINAYMQVILAWIVIALAMLAIWWFSGRSWQVLGMGRPELARGLIGLLAAAVVTAMVVLPLRSMARSENCAELVDEQLGDVALFMPRTQHESSWFRAVSINAGITEELVYRGYLIWYLTQYFDIWWAAIIAMFLFGFAHTYQGLRQLPSVLFISAVAVGLYLFTQTLIIPILFHIALDVLQGHYFARMHSGQAKHQSQ